MNAPTGMGNVVRDKCGNDEKMSFIYLNEIIFNIDPYRDLRIESR